MANYHNQICFTYYSIRYNKTITVPEGYPSDGATGAIDVCPQAWFLHDVLCDRGYFDDGSPCTNWQASRVISDVLYESCNRWFRQYTWLWATFLFGGQKIKKENGWW